MNKINIIRAHKDLLCDYNDLYLLIKKYKLNFEYNRITKDLYISESDFNWLMNQRSRIVDKLLSLKELIDKRVDKIPIQQRYYLYFLFDNEDLIYIGQTCDLLVRIGNHKSGTNNKKKFNFVSYIECSSTKILAFEAFYIDKFKPKHNIAHIEGNKLINYVFEMLEKK